MIKRIKQSGRITYTTAMVLVFIALMLIWLQMRRHDSGLGNRDISPAGEVRH